MNHSCWHHRTLRLEHLERRYAHDAAGIDVGFEEMCQPQYETAFLSNWHNKMAPKDVDRDGAVSPLDALVILNSLTAHGSRALTPFTDSPHMLDVNGDAHVSPVDILLVINQLNSGSNNNPQSAAAAEAESDVLSAVSNMGAPSDLSVFAYQDSIAEIVRYSRFDVIVATVTAVDDSESTNDNPPILELDVEEVLRAADGKIPTRAIWLPPHHDYDVVPFPPEFYVWQETPLKGPAPGTKMILLGTVYNSPEGPLFRIPPVVRFLFSETNRAAAIRSIQCRGL